MTGWPTWPGIHRNPDRCPQGPSHYEPATRALAGESQPGGVPTCGVASCCVMMPPAGAVGQPVGLADAFDIPVFVRHSSPILPERRPRKNRIDGAWSPWPTVGDVPLPGDYLVPTTWREVVDAAMTVGRDPVVWLAAVPGLASAEIIARRSPLAAYLCRTHSPSLPFRAAGYCLEPNVVYQEGTEKTARALFAYRIGMTMAEWVCRGLMGLGPTIHAEAVPLLLGRGPAWSQKNGQPDLVGFHRVSPEPWLVEAKGARRARQARAIQGSRSTDCQRPNVRAARARAMRDEHRA